MAGLDETTSHPITMDGLYFEANICIDHGKCYDEIGMRQEALEMYERGLRLIDQAGLLPDADADADADADSDEMYQQMLGTRERIGIRIRDLQSGAPQPPPPYDNVQTAREDLLFISDGVQIFFVRGQDTTTPSYPTRLRIFKIRQSAQPSPSAGAAATPTAFLQVGDWVYPLVPGRSPVLHSDYGAYIFANPTADAPDAHVGLMLPSDVDRTLVEQFENYMKELTMLKTQDVEADLTKSEQERLSTKISNYLIAGGNYLACGITIGAEKSVKLIGDKCKNVRSRSPKSDTPVDVNPHVGTGVKYLRSSAKLAVDITGYLADKIGVVATHVGKSIATEAGKRFPQSTSRGSIVNGVLEVAAGGVAGVSTVWMSLEDAARVLAKGIANETVQTVDHKYGEHAASVTNDILHSAGYTAATAIYIDSMGIRGIAKRTAKETGRAILNDRQNVADTPPPPPPPNGNDGPPSPDANDEQPPPDANGQPSSAPPK